MYKYITKFSNYCRKIIQRINNISKINFRAGKMSTNQNSLSIRAINSLFNSRSCAASLPFTMRRRTARRSLSPGGILFSLFWVLPQTQPFNPSAPSSAGAEHNGWAEESEIGQEQKASNIGTPTELFKAASRPTSLTSWKISHYNTLNS